MKINDIVWFAIIGLWTYGAFTNNQWLAFVVAPLFIGLFIIITNKKQVDDRNEFFIRMSKRVPFLFPPSWIGKTNYKFQRWITVLLGISFIVFAITNWVRIF